MLGRYLTVVAIAAVGALPPTWASLQAQNPAPQPATGKVDFARDIQPILAKHCYECHGPSKTRGQLRLDLRAAAMQGGETGAAIVPGNSDRSLIVRRVLGLDGEER